MSHTASVMVEFTRKDVLKDTCGRLNMQMVEGQQKVEFYDGQKHAVDLTIQLHGIGKLDAYTAIYTVTITSGQTEYELNTHLLARAVKMYVTIQGIYPPDVHFLGVRHDTARVR